MKQKLFNYFLEKICNYIVRNSSKTNIKVYYNTLHKTARCYVTEDNVDILDQFLREIFEKSLSETGNLYAFKEVDCNIR